MKGGWTQNPDGSGGMQGPDPASASPTGHAVLKGGGDGTWGGGQPVIVDIPTQPSRPDKRQPALPTIDSSSQDAPPATLKQQEQPRAPARGERPRVPPNYGSPRTACEGEQLAPEGSGSATPRQTAADRSRFAKAQRRSNRRQRVCTPPQRSDLSALKGEHATPPSQHAQPPFAPMPLPGQPQAPPLAGLEAAAARSSGSEPSWLKKDGATLRPPSGPCGEPGSTRGVEVRVPPHYLVSRAPGEHLAPRPQAEPGGLATGSAGAHNAWRPITLVSADTREARDPASSGKPSTLYPRHLAISSVGASAGLPSPAMRLAFSHAYIAAAEGVYEDVADAPATARTKSPEASLASTQVAVQSPHLGAGGDSMASARGGGGGGALTPAQEHAKRSIRLEEEQRAASSARSFAAMYEGLAQEERTKAAKDRPALGRERTAAAIATAAQAAYDRAVAAHNSEQTPESHARREEAKAARDAAHQAASGAAAPAGAAAQRRAAARRAAEFEAKQAGFASSAEEHTANAARLASQQKKLERTMSPRDLARAEKERERFGRDAARQRELDERQRDAARRRQERNRNRPEYRATQRAQAKRAADRSQRLSDKARKFLGIANSENPNLSNKAKKSALKKAKEAAARAAQAARDRYQHLLESGASEAALQEQRAEMDKLDELVDEIEEKEAEIAREERGESPPEQPVDPCTLPCECNIPCDDWCLCWREPRKEPDSSPQPGGTPEGEGGRGGAAAEPPTPEPKVPEGTSAVELENGDGERKKQEGDKKPSAGGKGAGRRAVRPKGGAQQLPEGVYFQASSDDEGAGDEDQEEGEKVAGEEGNLKEGHVRGPGDTGPIPVEGEPPNSDKLKAALKDPANTTRIEIEVRGMKVVNEVSFAEEGRVKVDDETTVTWGTFENNADTRELKEQGKTPLGTTFWYHVDGKDGHQYAWVQYVHEDLKWTSLRKKKVGTTHRRNEGIWHPDSQRDDKFYPEQASEKGSGTALMTDSPRTSIPGSATNPQHVVTAVGNLLEQADDPTVPEDATDLDVRTQFETYLVDLTAGEVVGKLEKSMTVSLTPSNFVEEKPLTNVSYDQQPRWTPIAGR